MSTALQSLADRALEGDRRWRGLTSQRVHSAVAITAAVGGDSRAISSRRRGRLRAMCGDQGSGRLDGRHRADAA